MKKALVASLLLALPMFADVTKPPMAKKVPKSSTIHGDTRVDDYAWIRDKSSPEVIAHLQAENAYADSIMASTAPLQKSLYDEMLSHI